MSRLNKVLLGIIILILAGFAAREFYAYKTTSHIAYVNISELYDGFAYKKEMESKLTNVQQTRKTILDSLELSLQVLAASIAPNKDRSDEQMAFENKRREYLVKKRKFTEDNESMTQEYSSQVMKQLNQYIQDYGNENGYTYILGAGGDGSIMFAEKSHDITKEVLTYLNEKYKGIK